MATDSAKIGSQGVLRVGPDGVIVGASAAACLVLGSTEHALLGRDCSSLAAIPAQLSDLFDRAVADEAAHGELELVRPGGRGFLAELTCVRVESVASSPLLLSFRDVSEQRSEEARVAELHDAHRAFFDQAAPATIIRAVPGPDGAITDWELVASSARMLSLPGVAQVPGSRLMKDFATGRPELARHCLEALTTGTVRSYEAPLGGRDFVVTIYPLVDGMLGVIGADVTAERAAQRALDDEQGRFDAFIETAPAMKWMKDSAGRYLYVNKAWERELGLSRGQVLGHTDVELFDAELARQRGDLEQVLLHTGDPVLSLEHLEAATGRAGGWFRYSHFRIPDRSGVFLTGGIGRNVTAEKLADDALHESEARALANERKLELALEATRRTEEKLRQSQKMEAIGKLAGGVAHDFNNLLTVILGNAEFLETRTTGASETEVLREISDAGKRAAELTRQLLAFSRRQVLEPKVLDLNAVVHGLEGLLRRLVGEDVEFNVLPRAHLHLCRVDPGQIEQVIMNLVVNARDAMPDGGRLTIETANVVFDEAYAATHGEVSPGEHVMLSISDTGTGMSPETQARLFEPFFTTKPLGKGTGLGLSTVYGIVRQSGGTLWVYSELGQGSTFKVYFPRSLAPADALAPRGRSPTLGGHETILLVEDHPAVRRAVHQMLAGAGYQVLEATNGNEALALCEQDGIVVDLVLTDVIMPKLNGRLLAERLRKVRPQLKVIFMSGYTDDVVVHHGVLDAGVDFLQKPLIAEALLTKVRAVLDRPHDGSGARGPSTSP